MKFRDQLGCFAATLVLFPVFSRGAGATADGNVASADTTEPKPISLFMGTDISVERDKKLFHVWDVTGSAFVISVDGKPDAVQMRGSPHNLKVDHSLKLSEYSASVTGLAAERAYTPGNDPRMRRQAAAATVSAAIGDNASLAMGKYIAAQNNFYTGIDPAGGGGYAKISVDAIHAAAEAASIKGQSDMRLADSMQSSNLTSGAFAQLEAERDLNKQRFDAVELEFTVSSETPLASPYVVFLVDYLEKEDQPKTARNMISARPLEPIDQKPRKVHFLHGGLPPGYVLKGYQVHLYNNGYEIATNVAPNRVPLTREQAFLYLKADYLRQHKGATLAATPAMGKLSPDTKAQLTHEQLVGRYFVKVSSDGNPLAAFADEACTQPVDPAIAALTEKVRFFPALENGKRVEGTARLVFTQLNF